MKCQVCNRIDCVSSKCIKVMKDTAVRVARQHKAFIDSITIPICKNKDCNNPIEKTSNAIKYCSDACKPKRNQTKAYREMRKEQNKRYRSSDKEDSSIDKFKGTIDKKWIEPQGSKQRKLLGIDKQKSYHSTEFSGLGRFVY